MTVYATAVMLCGQFGMVLAHDSSIKVGTVVIIPTGKDRGVYINHKDAE